jgi:hypothetical protein
MKSVEAFLPQGVDLPGSKCVHIIPDVKEEQSCTILPYMPYGMHIDSFPYKLN